MVGPTEDGFALRQRIEALERFLPLLESRNAGRWHGGDRLPDGTITAPYFEYSPGMLDFIRACGENGWIEVFDWTSWGPEALRLYQDPQALASARVEDIRRLLTLHIRRDRFSEGHLAAMVGDGHLAAVVRRLAAIRESGAS